MKYSEEDLADLTPDEQEAIAAAQEEVSDTSTEETPIADESTEQSAEATAAEQSATGGDGEQQAPEAEAVAAEFRPEFKAAAPEGLSDRLAALDQQESDIEKAFDEGNIERDEMRRQLKAIANERTDLKIAESQANWAKSQNDAVVEQRWKWEQERFFGQASADIYKDGLVMAALNASVVQLSNDPANAKRPAAWFLEEADRQVRSRFGVGNTAAETPKVVDLAARAKQPTVRTIGTMPAAAPAPTGDDRLEKIGMLEGDDLESYVARMSVDDRKKLARGAA